MSLTNIKKTRGARTVPCGTPDRTLIGAEHVPLTTTLWFLWFLSLPPKNLTFIFRSNYTVECLILLWIRQGCKLLCHSISRVTAIDDVNQCQLQLFSFQIFSIWQLFVLVGFWVTLKLTPLVSQLEWSPKAWGTIDLIAVCWIPFESPLFVQYHMKNVSLNHVSLFWDKGKQLSNFSFWPRLCMYKLVVRDLTAWLAQLGERRSAEREVTGSNPGRTNTQGL